VNHTDVENLAFAMSQGIHLIIWVPGILLALVRVRMHPTATALTVASLLALCVASAGLTALLATWNGPPPQEAAFGLTAGVSVLWGVGTAGLVLAAVADRRQLQDDEKYADA